mgnify:CR=1 FL=1
MPILGVDLDGVIADLIGFFILAEAAETKKIYNYRNFNNFRFTDNLDSDTANKWSLWLQDPVKILQMLPYSESVYALKYMDAASWHIYIITSRQEHLEDATRMWLINHGVPFNKLFLVSDKKSLIDQTDYYVDDKIENVAIKTPSKTFLMRRPWNREHWNSYPSIKSLWELLEKKK